MITLGATYQQAKSLVDPVMSTYETVLTIDPSLHYSRVVGTYNCTVENDRGGSSETVVVPGKVEPSHSGIHTVPLFCFHTSVVKLLHIKGVKSANVISHAICNGIMHAVVSWSCPVPLYTSYTCSYLGAR